MTAQSQQASLSRAESFERLATAWIGRLVLTANALPAARPVHFALDGDCIVFRSDLAMRLSAARSGTVVAFQADSFDAERETGWSVQVTGVARLISEECELQRVHALAIPTWVAQSTDGTYARIEPGLVTGLRFAG